MKTANDQFVEISLDTHNPIQQGQGCSTQPTTSGATITDAGSPHQAMTEAAITAAMTLAAAADVRTKKNADKDSIDTSSNTSGSSGDIATASSAWHLDGDKLVTSLPRKRRHHFRRRFARMMTNIRKTFRLCYHGEDKDKVTENKF